jgi:hypothetical protein
MKRKSFPEHSLAALDFAGELWDCNSTNYQGHLELDARFRSLNRQYPKRMLAWHLADFLLDDVLVAAAGLEAALVRFRVAIAETTRRRSR